jgi:hypothetical protein
MRLGVWLLVVVVAYGVAWVSDIALNGDTCAASGRETDREDLVQRWVPPHSDCRLTGRDGESRIVQGDAQVSLAMFALTLVLAAALLARGALALRALTALAACGAAFLVIFVV